VSASSSFVCSFACLLTAIVNSVDPVDGELEKKTKLLLVTGIAFAALQAIHVINLESH
jgi:hypothetical protein